MTAGLSPTLGTPWQRVDFRGVEAPSAGPIEDRVQSNELQPPNGRDANAQAHRNLVPRELVSAALHDERVIALHLATLRRHERVLNEHVHSHVH